MGNLLRFISLLIILTPQHFGDVALLLMKKKEKPRNDLYLEKPRPPYSRVNRTGGNRSGNRGNRSYRSGPVLVPVGSQPVQIQILNLNSKKIKNLTKLSKILQRVYNIMVSKTFKYSFV
jgi:hypothetical protein